MPDLGEQAISKIAEVGIASQLDEVENLDVAIQTDPLKVISGAVDSVTIAGQGLVMQQDLRVEKMQLNTGSIAINPLSAALGKIELTRPTDADLQVILTEADLNRAFNSEFIQGKMQNLSISVDGQPQTVNTQQVELRLPGEGKLAIAAELHLHETGTLQKVAFTAVPTLSPNGECIQLEQVEYTENSVPEVAEALLAQAQALLDLRNFSLEGMSLRLKALDVQAGRMKFRAEAAITQFPS
ncbi:MAG TPA: DUF2993 domain-containing protein [Thermosynechococcaceae cyanobacterium]